MDRVGLRIIVASVPECYSILSFLHTHFKPIPGTFDDYIGLPKDNGCQSWYTCVYPVREISHKPIETQICTDVQILPGANLKVNGKNAGPDYQFRDGDTIEIVENGNHATTN
jgi:(p)ppGpp synthase/HD superfamily hydrolase